jgi:hypothetical protein
MLSYKASQLAVVIIISLGVNGFFSRIDSHLRRAFLQSYQAGRCKDDESDSYFRVCKEYCLYDSDDCEECCLFGFYTI